VRLADLNSDQSEVNKLELIVDRMMSVFSIRNCVFCVAALLLIELFGAIAIRDKFLGAANAIGPMRILPMKSFANSRAFVLPEIKLSEMAIASSLPRANNMGQFPLRTISRSSAITSLFPATQLNSAKKMRARPRTGTTSSNGITCASLTSEHLSCGGPRSEIRGRRLVAQSNAAQRKNLARLPCQLFDHDGRHGTSRDPQCSEDARRKLKSPSHRDSMRSEECG
jgi:hypothetical protein